MFRFNLKINTFYEKLQNIFEENRLYKQKHWKFKLLFLEFVTNISASWWKHGIKYKEINDKQTEIIYIRCFTISRT